MLKLTLNEKQADVLLKALDLYSRLQIGQVKELHSVFTGMTFPDEDAEQLLEAVKRHYFPELTKSSYHGIASKEIPDEARVAFDLQQVVRHARAWSKNPEGGIQVDFDEPMKLSQEPLPPVDTFD